MNCDWRNLDVKHIADNADAQSNHQDFWSQRGMCGTQRMPWQEKECATPDCADCYQHMLEVLEKVYPIKRCSEFPAMKISWASRRFAGASRNEKKPLRKFVRLIEILEARKS